MPGVGKEKYVDLGLCRMDPDQIKEVRLSSFVAFGMGTELLNIPK